MFSTNQLFETALGITTPWFIKEVTYDENKKRLDIHLDFKKGSEFNQSVHVDKIYQTRANRKFCKDNDIRMTGKPLGIPKKETDKNKEELEAERKQRYQDDVDRITVEGRLILHFFLF